MLGKVLALPAMQGRDGSELLKLINKLEKAKRADRVAATKDAPADLISKIIDKEDGNDDPDRQERKADAVLAELMPTLRAAYEGYVIRRTRHSVDNEGKLISILPPLVERVLLLRRGPLEEQYIESLAAAEDDDDEGRAVVDWITGNFGSRASKVRL